jgi:hypothetical protein
LACSCHPPEKVSAQTESDVFRAYYSVTVIQVAGFVCQQFAAEQTRLGKHTLAGLSRQPAGAIECRFDHLHQLIYFGFLFVRGFGLAPKCTPAAVGFKRLLNCRQKFSVGIPDRWQGASVRRSRAGKSGAAAKQNPARDRQGFAILGTSHFRSSIQLGLW